MLEQIPASSHLFECTARLLDELLVPAGASAPPPPTLPGRERFLTIGMATYDDYDGVYFSAQAIRLYHPEITENTEILVLDNHPGGPCSAALKKLETQIAGCRYVSCGTWHGTAVRDLLFREANSPFVLVMDSHILFAPGSLARLVEFLKACPESNDLWQGPLLYDNLTSLSTHFAPEWSGGMYGVWRCDERGADAGGPPFEVPMQGLGVFACRTQAWPGFNPRLSGFGGEEGYIHEKIRRNGGAVFCLPFLRWIHRFDRPMGTQYPHDWKRRIRNYLIEWDELGLDPAPVVAHFERLLGSESAQPLVEAARREITGPFHLFDAIYQTGGAAGPADLHEKIRRVPATVTAVSSDIGRALAHREIVEDARRQGLETILALESDCPPGASDALRTAVLLLQERSWAGCRLPGALAVRRTIFNRLLEDIPKAPSGIALWLRRRGSLDAYYADIFRDGQ